MGPIQNLAFEAPFTGVGQSTPWLFITFLAVVVPTIAAVIRVRRNRRR